MKEVVFAGRKRNTGGLERRSRRYPVSLVALSIQVKDAEVGATFDGIERRRCSEGRELHGAHAGRGAARGVGHSSSGVLRDTAWYYVQSRVENLTYHAPRVVDRTVLAVNFDQRGVVRGIERYGLEDGRVVNLSVRTTETGGREMGVIEQLFGNVLNLDAERLNDF